MRLGTFARNYDLPLQELITFLKASNTNIPDINANTKLDENTMVLVADAFGFQLNERVEKEEDTAHEKAKELTKNETDAPVLEIDGVIGQVNLTEGDHSNEILEETTDENTNDGPGEGPQRMEEYQKDAIEIRSDHLLELLDAQEESIDLSKITTIRAPKKELSGLKVLGKIDLPEKKEKPENKRDETHNPKRPPRSEEEIEKRRLRAKRKKEAFEERQKKLRQDQEKARLKKVKEDHYRKKLEKASSTKAGKHKKKISGPTSSPDTSHQAPKSLLGKFWKWLNT